MVSILPIIVNTGKFTGRSPKDRYFVKTKLNEKVIDWGTRNNFISENTFRDLNKQMDLFLKNKTNKRNIGVSLETMKKMIGGGTS